MWIAQHKELLKLNIVDNTTIRGKTLGGADFSGATMARAICCACPGFFGTYEVCLAAWIGTVSFGRITGKVRVMVLRIFAIILGVAGVCSGVFADAQPGGHDLRGASATARAPMDTQSTGPDLIRANNCLACHQVNGKRVGPAFTLIAQRFAGQTGAAEYLAGAIRRGGKGRWGPVPMPAQPQVSPAQASAIAAWILTLAAPGRNPS